jgi:hypothetical protein
MGRPVENRKKCVSSGNLRVTNPSEGDKEVAEAKPIDMPVLHFVVPES